MIGNLEPKKAPEPALTPIAVIANPEQYTNIQIHSVRTDGGYSFPHDGLLLAITKGTVVVEPASHYNNHQAKIAEGLLLVTARHTNAELVALTERVDQAQRDRAMAHNERAEAVRAGDAAVKRATELTKQVAELTAQRDFAKTQANEKEGAKRLLEAHLAKVRNYFGEKAFQEALAGPKPEPSARP